MDIICLEGANVGNEVTGRTRNGVGRVVSQGVGREKVDAAVFETEQTVGPEVVVLSDEANSLADVIGLDVLGEDFALGDVAGLIAKEVGVLRTLVPVNRAGVDEQLRHAVGL